MVSVSLLTSCFIKNGIYIIASIPFSVSLFGRLLSNLSSYDSGKGRWEEPVAYRFAFICPCSFDRTMPCCFWRWMAVVAVINIAWTVIAFHYWHVEGSSKRSLPVFVWYTGQTLLDAIWLWPTTSSICDRDHLVCKPSVTPVVQPLADITLWQFAASHKDKEYWSTRELATTCIIYCLFRLGNTSRQVFP